MSKKPPPKLQSFRVVEAGEDDWVVIQDIDAAHAGAQWAESRGPHAASRNYDLDVEDAGGDIVAVIVEVSVSVSYAATAGKHPSQP